MHKFSLQKSILIYFTIWRISLFFIAFISTIIIGDFGARFPYYKELLINTGLPAWVWGFGNFDGVHYLTIAQTGYAAQFTQAFFPFYPLLVKLLTINGAYLLTALVLSNILFLAALFLLYKLFRMDYDSEISFKSLCLLLAIPTSFYFGAVHSESLFLFFSVGSILAIRKKKYILSGLLAGFASATRIVGIFLTPLILIEIISSLKIGTLKFKNKEFIKPSLALLIAPMGLIIYMIFLKIQFNDPLYFLNAQHAFGTGRSDQNFILLPQVFYRYIKILLTVNITSLPFFNALLELIFTVIPLTVLFMKFKKIRFSYLVFTWGSLLLPTLTGTLTSMPRFILMGFLLLPVVVISFNKHIKVIMIIMIILQILLLSLFIRGYWVA
ncbi:hypothetical protein HYW46_05880 [Candidatus Daviesbacteria bacterium]|nr:hypothetical protein [Candidatus Daviesbacteria bacterium]